MSNHAVDKLNTAKMHGLDMCLASQARCVEHIENAFRQARHSRHAWAQHVERVESCQDVTGQVEFGL